MDMNNKKWFMRLAVVLGLSGAFSHSIYATVFPPKENFLYTTRVGSALTFVLANAYTAKLAGWFANTRLSRFCIRPFARHYGIEHEIGDRSFTTFNEFFSRTKPLSIPCAQDNKLVSPADGRIFCITNIQENQDIRIKNKTFSLSKLFGDPQLAKKFVGGSMVIIYLAPQNYHRFHFPCNAQITSIKTINGKYESVHPSIASHLSILQENQRMCMHMRSEKNREFVCMPVGAMFVGAIHPTAEINKQHKKGDEIGYFSFGGSTVVLLFPPNSITLKTCKTDWSKIDVGQEIGTWN